MTTLRLLLLCTLLGPIARAAESFDAWAERFSADWARQSPQFVTAAQYFSGAEQDRFDRQLSLVGADSTYGRTAAEQRAALARRGLQELAAFPRATLTPMQRSSAALLQWSCEIAIDDARHARSNWVFDQFNGLHLELVNFLTQTHPMRNRRDAENYLARLALVPDLLEQGVAEAQATAQEGFVPPRFILERMLEQIDTLLAPAPAENQFVATFRTRLHELGGKVSAADAAGLVADAEKLLTARVAPAYRRVHAALAGQMPKAGSDAGAWRLPDGAGYYRHQLRRFTTTAMTPDEIHALGEREVARIRGEMDQLFRQLGYREGSIKERYAQLEKANQPPANPDPRPALLARATQIVRDAEQRAQSMFDLVPRARVEVLREPAFTEVTAAAHYKEPAPDGSRPGVFYYPLPGPQFEMVDMRSLSYHEAVPGHHFQLAIQQESRDLPRFRKLGVYGFISAYGEGWALYAERLADENGWYEGDPMGRIGYLESMHYRAQRLVADTGLHHKKWTREQVIEYGFSPQEAERYIVWPGQATSYMIGQLRIVELREKARAALGAKFSIKKFHNLVLGLGNVPLSVVAEEVDAWIAAQR